VGSGRPIPVVIRTRDPGTGCGSMVFIAVVVLIILGGIGGVIYHHISTEPPSATASKVHIRNGLATWANPPGSTCKMVGVTCDVGEYPAACEFTKKNSYTTSDGGIGTECFYLPPGTTKFDFKNARHDPTLMAANSVEPYNFDPKFPASSYYVEECNSGTWFTGTGSGFYGGWGYQGTGHIPSCN
jgi:uncharacterized protein YceK